MQRSKPPFRADMVGSLLRPEPLKEARARHAAGRDRGRASFARSRTGRSRRSSASRRRSACKSATDGEFRRSWWHFDFLAGLEGCELVQLDQGIQFHGVQTKAESIAITGKLGWPADHPMLEHFKFLKAHHQARRRR